MIFFFFFKYCVSTFITDINFLIEIWLIVEIIYFQNYFGSVDNFGKR